jgi:hypothetical protein
VWPRHRDNMIHRSTAPVKSNATLVCCLLNSSELVLYKPLFPQRTPPRFRTGRVDVSGLGYLDLGGIIPGVAPAGTATSQLFSPSFI